MNKARDLSLKMVDDEIVITGTTDNGDPQYLRIDPAEAMILAGMIREFAVRNILKSDRAKKMPGIGGKAPKDYTLGRTPRNT